MLKFTDSEGTTVAILEDDGSEPEFTEDAKKKKLKKASVKQAIGYVQLPLNTNTIPGK